MKIEVQHAHVERPVSADPHMTSRESIRDEDDHVLPGIGVPKALFFLAAALSCAMSIFLFFSGDREQGIFVGLWVPSILSAGALLLGSNGHE